MMTNCHLAGHLFCYIYNCRLSKNGPRTCPCAPSPSCVQLWILVVVQDVSRVEFYNVFKIPEL